eukprot:g438.t1
MQATAHRLLGLDAGHDGAEYVGGGGLKRPRLSTDSSFLDVAAGARPALPVEFHNEMAYRGSFPRKLAFAMVRPAACGGGATLLADNSTVTARLSSKLRDKFRLGLIYNFNYYCDQDDDEIEDFSSWQTAFGTTDLAVAMREGNDLTGYHLYRHRQPFALDGGSTLSEFDIAYETWGTLSYRKDNVILLHCGMSASSHAKSTPENESAGWWEQFIGPGRPLDTNLFFIICSNNLGGCYGTTGPSSTNPATGQPYGSGFPMLSVQDMVRAQFELLDSMGIETLHASVGASLGGMQSVCAAALFPERVGKFVSISACARSFPGSIAFRYTQRQAVMSDPNWNGGDYYGDGQHHPDAGLKLAREIGTITYRSGPEWQMRFGRKRAGSEVEDLGRDPQRPLTVKGLNFEIEAYLRHQGQKWLNQFDANTMVWISKAMDAFTLEQPGPGKSGEAALSLEAGLSGVQMPALVIGVQTDVLFPCWQQKEIADTLKKVGNKHVTYYELDAIFGHDTFLLDVNAIGSAVKGHIEQEPGGSARLWEDAAEATGEVLAKLVRTDYSDETLRQMFKAIERPKGSGKCDVTEAKTMISLVWSRKGEVRMSRDDIDQLVATFDKNEDRQISKREFLEIGKSIRDAHYTAI